MTRAHGHAIAIALIVLVSSCGKPESNARVQELATGFQDRALAAGIGFQMNNLRMEQGEQSVVVTVRQMDEESVTLDANHPLAGEALTFDLELVEIV